MFLGTCFADEIMVGSEIKQNASRMSVQRKHTREDFLTLRNILHGSVVDVVDLCNNHLL
jgi:hypothetical protein